MPANGLHPEGATIAASTLAETAKTLPKKLKCYGDMRGAFAVSRAPEPEDKKTSRGPVIITRIDNDFQPAVTQAREMPEGYPTFDHVMPKEEPSLSITLSADLLKKIADYAIANGENVKGHHPVRLEFTDNLSPVRFTIPLAVDRERKATGILMVMRMI